MAEVEPLTRRLKTNNATATQDQSTDSKPLRKINQRTRKLSAARTTGEHQVKIKRVMDITEGHN